MRNARHENRESSGTGKSFSSVVNKSHSRACRIPFLILHFEDSTIFSNMFTFLLVSFALLPLLNAERLRTGFVNNNNNDDLLIQRSIAASYLCE